MHNWGSVGSITLNHPPQPTTPTPTHPRPAHALRNTPSDAHNEEETRRLRQEAREDLEHIEVQHKEARCCNTKYSQALKHLLPWRPARKDKKLVPGNQAGLVSYVGVTWLTKLMIKAYRHGLDPGDMWTLQYEDSAEVNSARLEQQWEEEQEVAKAKRKPELWRAVWRSIRTRVLVCIAISIVNNILHFFGPSIMVKLVLDYIAEPETDNQYASLIIFGLFAINLSRASSFNGMFVIGTHTATRATGAIQAMIYKKVLRLKTGGETLSAQVINFYNNDMERIFEACISCVFVTSMPVLFTMSIVYCLYILGPWSLLGQGVYLLFYPIMAVIAKAQSSVRVATVKVTDKRVSLMSEVLNSMRLIKMYSWEDSFSRKISDIRKEELKKHRIGALLQAVSSTVIPGITILATIVTFMGYTLSGSSLKSSEAFTIFSVFNAMQFTVGVLPYTVRVIAEAKISLNRIQKLLELPEHSKDSGGQLNNNLVVQIKDADFSWELLNIDFKQKGPDAAPSPSSSSGELKNGG